MARARTSDFYHSHEFHVVEEGGFLNPAAGFNNVTVPEITLEMAEYREGVRTWTIKQPGYPTVDNVTMSRGVAKRDTDFYNWVITVIEGRTGYRTDLELWHFHGTDDFGLEGNPSRTYKLHEAFPTRVRVAADFDATSAEISLEELEVAVEQITITRREG